jgi:hypothetical protein
MKWIPKPHANPNKSKETTLKHRNPSLSNEPHKLMNNVSKHCIQFMFKIKKEKQN